MFANTDTETSKDSDPPTPHGEQTTHPRRTRVNGSWRAISMAHGLGDREGEDGVEGGSRKSLQKIPPISADSGGWK